MNIHRLCDGQSLPEIGFGTYSLNGAEGAAQVASALAVGYRLIDTALGYHNEDAVGDAVRRCGLARSEVLITSKVPPHDLGYANTKRSLDDTLRNLGTDYVDLHLIHWPEPHKDLYVETWQALIEAQQAGKVVSIGVSNFEEEQLLRLIAETGVTPVVNQIQLHPGKPQAELRAVNAGLGILTQSYSPLKNGERLRSDPVLAKIAAAHEVSPNQVALRWNIQLGALPIPRSRDVEHQRQNFDVFGFELTVGEVGQITALNWD